MIKSRKQSSTDYPIAFLMVDEEDHVTGKTGLIPTVTISKNGAAFATADGLVSELSNGWYVLEGNADDRDTLGDLLIHVSAAGADPSDLQYAIVEYDPFTFLSASLFPAGAIEYTYTVLSDITPVSGADVWISTDEDGNNVVWRGATDMFGIARDVLNNRPFLDAGTYYVWVQKSGFVPLAFPDTEIVS
jgi:hypothetical protein